MERSFFRKTARTNKLYCIVLNCIVLSNVVTPTRKSLEFKHASQ